MTDCDVIRVKICGVTTADDACAAAQAGADAVGLNFVDGPRRIDTAAAESILRALPALCTPVALVDVSDGDVPAELLDLLGRYWVNHLQLYGRVLSTTLTRLCADGFKPILVEHGVAERIPGCVDQLLERMRPVVPAAILLDGYSNKMQGGTGSTADWAAIAAARDAGRTSSWPPLILAGGLTPENVARAVAMVRPWAVDVSSGVESSVGRKDPARVAAFVAGARRGASRHCDR